MEFYLWSSKNTCCILMLRESEQIFILYYITDFYNYSSYSNAETEFRQDFQALIPTYLEKSGGLNETCRSTMDQT